MRFFVKNRFDVHNSGMATDRHQAPSYPLRMPDELKARIQAAADASGRSLHAELLHRLQSSTEEGAGPAVIVDQAHQIWELRQRVAQCYVAIGQALGVLLEEPGYDAAEVIPGLKAALQGASADAGEVLNRLISEYAQRADAHLNADLRALVSAISNHDFSSPG
ncbi:Arc family DNA-binding protein [Delftia sp. K82]|uniref:Arc family DNA-binding protein n=1 Tax=Delftia sp. K82 TaxID=1472718 RepID=UPI0015C58DCD|nr:Arc family DNA-binding protein [Delftia sp. K82]